MGAIRNRGILLHFKKHPGGSIRYSCFLGALHFKAGSVYS